jgi:hypothetical protein
MIHSLHDNVFRPALARRQRGENLSGIRILASGAGCGREGEARCQLFQAVTAFPRSRHRDLADMPGKTARSTQEPAADNGPSTNSTRYRQEEKIAASASTEAILAPSCGLSIIQSQNGIAEEIGQARNEREVCRNGQGRRIDGRPEAAPYQTGHGRRDTAIPPVPVSCGIGGSSQPHLCSVGGLRWNLPPLEDAVSQDQRHSRLAAADIDCENRSRWGCFT